MNYLYDGSFEGFLTCVYEHYYSRKAHNISREEDFQETLLAESVVIETDPVKSDRVYNGIICRISRSDLISVYKTLGSVVVSREMKCLRYLELGFKMGSKVQLLHGNPIVHDVEDAVRKVNFEIHRMYGLIRFSVVKPAGSLKSDEELHEILYAPIEPDNDILEFLVYHFIDRYRKCPFIIHDRKRRKAVVYGSGQWYITDFENDDLLEHTKGEIQYSKLWKMYFETIGIKERTNSRCQRNFMPARYWKNLTEIDSSNGL